MSYFRRKCSGILETDDAFFQPVVILLLHEDTVVITPALTRLDRSRISALLSTSALSKSRLRLSSQLSHTNQTPGLRENKREAGRLPGRHFTLRTSSPPMLTRPSALIFIGQWAVAFPSYHKLPAA